MSIGERRRPDPQGQPGFLRVDTVHGDRDGVKGVYHINAVESHPVASGRLSEALEPLLKAMIEQFPFRVRASHSTTAASSSIAGPADRTDQVRPRHSNDGGIEKRRGDPQTHGIYAHRAPHAGRIQRFYQQHFNPYLNFHRPCGQPEIESNAKGKQKRVYRHYQTPWESFEKLPEAAISRQGTRLRLWDGPGGKRHCGGGDATNQAQAVCQLHARQDAMLNSRKRVVEMPDGGKRGKPKPGFPRFPPPLEIAPRFPHSHNSDEFSRSQIKKGAPATQKAPTPVFRLIDEKMLSPTIRKPLQFKPGPRSGPGEEAREPNKKPDGEETTSIPSVEEERIGPRHLPPLYELIERGKVLALNMPAGSNPALARAVGVMLKNAWLQALLMRPTKMKESPGVYFRPAVFLCDEYQAFASVGEDDPSGDEKSFALTRQCRCIPIVATQSISSLRSVLGSSEAWRALLQTLRTRIFLSLSDDASAKIASEMCGQVAKIKGSYTISETSKRAEVSPLSGRAGGGGGSIGATKSFREQREAVFHPRDFTLLSNCQAICLPYDGSQSLEPRRVYLKPHYLPLDYSYWRAKEAGRL